MALPSGARVRLTANLGVMSLTSAGLRRLQAGSGGDERRATRRAAGRQERPRFICTLLVWLRLMARSPDVGQTCER